MSGREVRIEWNGRPVAAWLPDPLSERDLVLSDATARRTEQASARLRHGSDQLPREWEALARLLLRAEGMASSFVEGVQARPADVAAAELDPTLDETSTWVAQNLAAARQALDEAYLGPLTRDALDRWHTILMKGASHLPDGLIGRPREAQGWIGGTSPLDAALVTPPPDAVPRLLDDLVAFVNRTDVDAVTQAAVAHAQFEIIHPYADGNGRVGRVLVGWILTKRLTLLSPPPVSMRIAVDRGGYLSGLTLFRLGDVDPWVRWFADLVSGAGDATVNLINAVEELHQRWTERLAGVRSDAAARRILPLLPKHPVVSAQIIADDLGVTDRAGRAALETLAERGILEPYQPKGQRRGRPRQWWMASELLSLVAVNP